MTNSSPLLVLQDLKIQYPDMQIGPVDLSISSGMIYAILGTNGSGKTSLLKGVMGILHLDHGERFWLGESIKPEETQWKQDVFYIPDEFQGPEYWDAHQMEQFYRYWYPNWNREYYQQLLLDFEIPISKSYGNLSMGNKKKLLISLALAAQPKLLIMDEATNGRFP